MSERHPVRGVLAGVAGGLVASWVMNVWSASAGAAISHKVETPQEKEQLARTSDGEDATMKTADAIASAVDGGRHLSHEQRGVGGPIVHYTYGALVGGLYGGLAEYSTLVRSGFGATYALALFVGGDLIAVPAWHLSKPLSTYPASSYVAPASAHVVYGLTTELVRRIVRVIL